MHYCFLRAKDYPTTKKMEVGPTVLSCDGTYRCGKRAEQVDIVDGMLKLYPGDPASPGPIAWSRGDR